MMVFSALTWTESAPLIPRYVASTTKFQSQGGSVCRIACTASGKAFSIFPPMKYSVRETAWCKISIKSVFFLATMVTTFEDSGSVTAK